MSTTKEQYEEMQRKVRNKALSRAFDPPYSSEPRPTGGLHSLIGPIYVTIDLDPIGAPRQSRKDAWAPSPRVLRYRAWKDRFVPACREAGWELPPVLRVEFEIAMPPSWSKKKKAEMLGKPHQQKPDYDNLAKAIGDAFGTDDGFVWDARITKRWAEKGRIILYR